MTLWASGILAGSANIQYLITLLRGDVLRQLVTLSIEVGSTTIAHLNCIVLGLGA